MIGLDPTSMFIRDSDLYWKWRKIGDDHLADWESGKSVYNILHDDFHARYIFIDTKRNPDIANFMRDNPVYFRESLMITSLSFLK